jgi:putative ATPase
MLKSPSKVGLSLAHVNSNEAYMTPNDQQIGLFNVDSKGENAASQDTPLAHRLRPHELKDFIGFDDLVKRHPFLKSGKALPSLILWGPPGSGKTTIAKLLSLETGLQLHSFNAVLAGVPELKKLIKDASAEALHGGNKRFALFIDEIHRFNKAQQDALLPYVEDGTLLLIGATTENPRSALNRALLSRVQLVELLSLDLDSLGLVLQRAVSMLELNLDQELIELLSYHAMGDARRALSNLELICQSTQSAGEITIDQAKQILLKNDRAYDKSGDRHYDVISAFIKSLRGSDPDAALLWLAVMLDGGEDPVFIARRLVIFASEDIGNADPQALTLAVSAMQASSAIGMPEARINLAQAVCYLASTTKSNACYQGINEAMEYVQNSTNLRVPDHLRNFPPKGAKPYLYPHSYPDHYVSQSYTPGKVPQFYRPTRQGIEGKIAERLSALRQKQD